MSRRAAIGAVIMVGWVVGLGVFARRELFRAPAQRLAEAALRISPGASYFIVEQNGARVGFGSSTIDTVENGLQVTDYLVADLPIGGTTHRATAQSVVRLSRALVLRDFLISFESDSVPISVYGRAHGDTLLEYVLSTEDAAADTQRVRLVAPLLLPTLLPLAIALSERPEVGKRYTFSTFDPMAMAPRDMSFTVRAESLFVVSDSAAFDASARRWVAAHDDTVRAWHLASEGGSFEGWVDEQGRLVEARQSVGFTLRRTAYEMAFENWRSARRATTNVPAARDLHETTAIAASAPLGGRPLTRLRVRLGAVSHAGFDLASNRQRMHGDTLTVRREPDASLEASYRLPTPRDLRRRFGPELAAAPLLERDHPAIKQLAERIARSAADRSDPRQVAQAMNRWVHDSLRKTITISLPSAAQVLRARSGDCNEHTQLFLALARAAGIPARGSAGLALVDGKFYYHAWPEVYLGDWVAVDPTFGQFPADAGHLRFVSGGIGRQAELLRLMGQLRLEVLDVD